MQPQLDNPLPPDPDDHAPGVQDALARVLLRLMDTDAEANIVFGNIPKGEAEDFAASIAFAEATGSPVILAFENMKNMAKRAEGGSLLDKILTTVRAVGKAVSEPKPGFFSRFRP